VTRTDTNVPAGYLVVALATSPIGPPADPIPESVQR
jgi:hypothetical protein